MLRNIGREILYFLTISIKNATLVLDKLAGFKPVRCSYDNYHLFNQLSAIFACFWFSA